MPTLYCDIETRSTANLRTCGAWVYASDPTTDAICLAYAVDDGNIPFQAIDEDPLAVAKHPVEQRCEPILVGSGNQLDHENCPLILSRTVLKPDNTAYYPNRGMEPRSRSLFVQERDSP